MKPPVKQSHKPETQTKRTKISRAKAGRMAQELTGSGYDRPPERTSNKKTGEDLRPSTKVHRDKARHDTGRKP